MIFKQASYDPFNTERQLLLLLFFDKVADHIFVHKAALISL